MPRAESDIDARAGGLAGGTRPESSESEMLVMNHAIMNRIMIIIPGRASGGPCPGPGSNPVTRLATAGRLGTAAASVTEHELGATRTVKRSRR